MLIAAGLPLPEHVFVHGFLLIGKDKMGKSAGNAIDPFAIIDEYGTDALRFYLMRDGLLRPRRRGLARGFRARYESELANDLGNLASRTIAMIHRYRDGVVPDAPLDPGLAAEIDGLERRGLRAARPRRPDAARRGDLAARAAAEPLRRGAGAVDAGEGPRRARASSTACWRRSPRRCASSRSSCTRGSPTAADKLLRRARRAELDARRARASRPAGSARSPSSTSCSPSTERGASA